MTCVAQHKKAIRWEINPLTNVMTKRCPRCGYILESKVKESDPNPDQIA